MDESQLLGEDGQIKPEIMERAKALIANIAELCKEEQPALVLFVLEAALTEQIAMFAPPLSELFGSMMRAYKNKATVLLSVLELIQNGRVNPEDLMRGDGAIGIGDQIPEPTPKE